MEFDYTTKRDDDTLMGGALQGYRLIHWLADVLRNWFSDPINIKDERISKLLKQQDGDADDKLDALFDIGTPYSQETTKACTTPMIIIGLGETQFPVPTVNLAGAGPIAECGAQPMYMGMRHKMIGCYISVATESYDGTVLLTGLIEDFLCINEYQLVQDNGMISEFRVRKTEPPKLIQQGTAVHAKPVYQAIIHVSAVGGVSWTTDTQGPVFRGIRVKATSN